MTLDMAKAILMQPSICDDLQVPEGVHLFSKVDASLLIPEVTDMPHVWGNIDDWGPVALDAPAWVEYEATPDLRNDLGLRESVERIGFNVTPDVTMPLDKRLYTGLTSYLFEDGRVKRSDFPASVFPTDADGFLADPEYDDPVEDYDQEVRFQAQCFYGLVVPMIASTQTHLFWGFESVKDRLPHKPLAGSGRSKNDQAVKYAMVKRLVPLSMDAKIVFRDKQRSGAGNAPEEEG